jgi:hypothetical protein
MSPNIYTKFGARYCFLGYKGFSKEVDIKKKKTKPKTSKPKKPNPKPKDTKPQN